MKKLLEISGCVLGLLLIAAACHSAWIERDYGRACFELMISFMVYPQGWIRNTLGKGSVE